MRKQTINNWTAKQDRLLKAIVDFSAWRARKDGFIDKAKDIETRMGISNGIKEFLPTVPQHKKENRGE